MTANGVFFFLYIPMLSPEGRGETSAIEEVSTQKLIQSKVFEHSRKYVSYYNSENKNDVLYPLSVGLLKLIMIWIVTLSVSRTVTLFVVVFHHHHNLPRVTGFFHRSDSGIKEHVLELNNGRKKN